MSHPRQSNWTGPLLAAPGALLLVVLLAGPLWLLIRVSLYAEAGGHGFYQPHTLTLDSYRFLLLDRYTHEVLLFTVSIGLGITLVVLIVAYPLALFIHSLPAPCKTLALGAVVLPKLASVLVVLYGLQLLLSSTGPVNQFLLALGVVHEPVMLFRNRIGVVIGEAYLIVPYAVLVLVSALEQIDPELLPAARGLGASRWQGFRRITWPLSRAGLILAGQLSLLWALGALLGPMLMGSPQETTLAVEVQRQTFERNNWPRGAATAVLMGGTILVCLALIRAPWWRDCLAFAVWSLVWSAAVLLRRFCFSAFLFFCQRRQRGNTERQDRETKAAEKHRRTPNQTSQARLSLWGGPMACFGRLLPGGGLLLLALLLWPLVHAAWVSFSPGELLQPPVGRWSLRWYELFFDSPRWTRALGNSFAVAILSVGFSLLCGTTLALALTRYHFRGRRLLSHAVLLPLLVPSVVLGMGLLPLVHAIGLWGWRLSLALAHALGSLPIVVIVIRSALEEVSPDLELAARGLGASPGRAFVRVTLPLIRPAILAGAVMAFILSLNELVLALFLAAPHIETLPKVIWPELRYSLTPVVAAASVVSMALTVLALLVGAAKRRFMWKRKPDQGSGSSPGSSGSDGGGGNSSRQQPRLR